MVLASTQPLHFWFYGAMSTSRHDNSCIIACCNQVRVSVDAVACHSRSRLGVAHDEYTTQLLPDYFEQRIARLGESIEPRISVQTILLLKRHDFFQNAHVSCQEDGLRGTATSVSKCQSLKHGGYSEARKPAHEDTRALNFLQGSPDEQLYFQYAPCLYAGDRHDRMG